MTVLVKHSKVSTIPDDADTSLVRPSDWNADHTLTGTIDVPNGGTGAATLTGYVKGNGTSAMTAVATVPSTDITGLGTMSTQNANAVAITGGTINGTTIGATTPSTVNATTITGQTEVLKGTGSNNLTYSQVIGGGGTSWSFPTSATATTNSVTAPDGTTTASTFTSIGSAGSGTRQIVRQFSTVIYPVTYTTSIYAKKGTANFVFLHELFVSGGNGVSNGIAWFNLNTGAVGTVQAGMSATITNVGSGWYRCTLTGTSSTTSSSGIVDIGISDADNSFVSTAATNIFLWGAQLEFGSTANTYIPTTTTAIYGTPTLSFSGVSEIGLLSNGALYLQPAGTGALQAQATTSTTAGGNARGANAVDWQTSRSSATAVASGQYSVLSGGNSNTSSSFTSSLVGGNFNTSSNQGSFVGGGETNTSSGLFSSSVSGRSNTASGYYGFVGNGFTNSTTSNSAVTTQSGTMNATTAVTLSGSNASIKVGQYITGTSIAGDTYVAAISGTALTLSKNASGSSTSTLSFFTPHGVVVGGGNNQATGSYSFIGGGGDAGTAANRNVASGDWSAVGGGTRNAVSNSYSVIAGGQNNTISSINSFVGGGFNHNVSNSYSSIVGGYQNTASGDTSVVLGGTFGTTRGISGYQTLTGNNNALGSGANGTIQSAILVLGKQTTDATATALTSNNSGAGSTNQVILPNNSAYFFRGEIISGVTGGGDTKGWTIEGVIKRGANAAATTLVGVTVLSTHGDAGAATWTIAVTADTTNGGIRVTFTGQLATTIRTVCQIRTTEMTF
jgi:hypothetical protein